jgi:hypothetical protein
MAEIVQIGVDELQAETELRSLLSPAKKGWWETSVQDDIEYLIATESRGLPPPGKELRTIRDVLDYLL